MNRRLCLAVTTFAGIFAAACHESSPPHFAEAPPDDGRTPTAPGGAALAPNVSFALAQSPLGLTASDGTGLHLSELRAEAVVEGSLAFTELRMTFQNPSERTLEGTFRITLPHGASMNRFAMKIGGEWQEGEVVELAEARRAYEDFLHRKQDPALMEKSAGNEFSARVFPIPARGTKEIVVSYMHEVNDGKYKLPLRGLPELGLLDASVRVMGGGNPSKLVIEHSAPKQDFVVDLPRDVKNGGVRSGVSAIIRVKPAVNVQPEPITSAVVLVDTSASRVLGFEEEVRLVDRLVKRLAHDHANTNVTIAAFDQTVAPIFEGRAEDFGTKQLDQLRERGPLGASDLEHALAWAREQAKKGHQKRVVLVTDGVATAGSTDEKKLGAEVARLREGGIERLDALAIGGIRDDVGLTRLVRGQLAHDGIVADVLADEPTALRRLGEATRSGVAVKVEGATWAWPTKLDGVQAGDTYSIYAEVPAGKPLRVSVDGKAGEVVALREVDRPLVERGVAQAKVASMLEREIAAKVDLKKDIVSLAVQQRIMTPYTAMLVLETEADYARFHIDRKSLKDVLAVQDGSVKRVHRTSIAMPVAVAAADPSPPQPAPEAREEASSTRSRSPRQQAQPAPAAGAAPPGVAASDRPAQPARIASNEPSPAKAAAAPPMMPTTPGAAPAPPPPPPPSARRMAPAGPPQMEAVAPSAMAPSALDDSSLRTRTAAPYEGPFAEIMAKLSRADQRSAALASARAWQKESPGDVLALVALGEAAEATERMELAARAYGSVIDLFPNRADLRRFAGERLERLKDAPATALAIDSFRKAAVDRPDHPSSHRLLAFALLRDKQFEKAFAAIVAGKQRGYEVDRFRGVERILAEDVGLVGAAWAHAEPSRKEQIMDRVRAAGGRIEDAPSLRFVLDWQTDANDVDFHIHDAKGGHAFYSAPHLQSGGDLYADVTTGYGPECFTIRLPRSQRSTYQLEAHYYSRGPMGYGMGKLEVIDHDGNGNLTFEERPFIVMVDSAFVDLGSVK